MRPAFMVDMCFIAFVVHQVFVKCGVVVVVVRFFGQCILTNCSGRVGRPAGAMHPVRDDAIGVCVCV